MTLSQYFRILRKRWLTVLSLTVMGVLVATGVTLMVPQVYAASATNFVTIGNGGSQNSALVQSPQFALANVTSYSGIVSSPTVLQPVIDDLHLKTTVPQLAKEVSATNPPGTVLIVVQAKSTSPTLATSIADAVSHQLGTTVEKLSTSRHADASQVTVSVATPASTPTSPVSPRPILNLALGLLVGLVFGSCLAVLRDHFDTSIKSPEALQEISGVAPLGAVPHDPSAAQEPLLALGKDPQVVESFRTIRTNLRFVDVDQPPRQVVVTSAVSGEGKTITACNLALALAQGARRVCLVEGDLRRPKACTYLGINGAIGLTDVIAGQYVLDDVLVPWNRGRITVLPAGTTPPDPSQLLGSHAVHDILARLREHFDFVIIDSPPVLPVSDAAVLSAASDGAIVVVRHGGTHRDKVASTIEQLQTAHTHLIGTVLIAVKDRRKDSAYSYKSSTRLVEVFEDSSLDSVEAHARRRHAADEPSIVRSDMDPDEGHPDTPARDKVSTTGGR